MRALPWLLLTVSVAFNVFFAIGFLHARHDAEALQTFQGRARVMAEKLDLDPAQQQKFESVLARLEALRGERTEERDAFITELVKDKPDESILRDYIAGPEANALRLKRLAIYREMIGMLSLDQRKRLVEMVRKRNSDAAQAAAATAGAATRSASGPQ